MNSWIWILLLWCCCGSRNNGCGICGNGCNNGGCNCDCDRDRDRDRDRDCDCDHNDNTPPCKPIFPPVPPCPPPNNGCGCNDDMIQPRNFSGFSGVGTCGCEEQN